MDVVRRSASELLERVAATLADDSEHNLPLGVAQQVADAGAKAFFATIEGPQGALEGAAVWTPPHRLLASRLSSEAAAALAAHLCDHALAPPGVLAPEQSARFLAEAWVGRTGASFRVAVREGLYEVRSVVTPPVVPGRLRTAVASDVERLSIWMKAFHDDVPVVEGITLEAARRVIEPRVAQGAIVVWDDGEPACMAGLARRTRARVAVNYVYTPPERRGRGFAKACVAELSRRQLEGPGGREACCLIADLDNPISNAVYLAIGYRPVADLLAIDFL